MGRGEAVPVDEGLAQRASAESNLQRVATRSSGRELDASSSAAASVRAART